MGKLICDELKEPEVCGPRVVKSEIIVDFDTELPSEKKCGKIYQCIDNQ